MRDGLRAALAGTTRVRLSGRRTELDVEVHGLAPERLERVLGRFGPVKRVGRAFPVLRVGALPLEIGLPRGASPAGEGPWAGFDPDVGFATAALGRDLRVNAMGFDPLVGELLDPHGGLADLRAGHLRATCPARFGEDPVRGLRTAQLAARLEMEPDDELLALCAATDLAGVPGERLFAEWRKLLLGARAPSRGLALLRETALLRFFPELAALDGVPQDRRWHPEGDVLTHTLVVVDAAARERTGGDADLALMLGALCHDLGKPATTRTVDETTTAHRHARAGVAPTEALLERLRAPHALVRAVAALVRHHLAPREFVRVLPGAGPRAYRRLARGLGEAGVAIDTLVRLARADHAGGAGRGDPHFANEARFVAQAERIDREPATHADVVQGRHVLARGVPPGEAVGEILARCRSVQEETGWDDPDRILDAVLRDR